MTVFEFEDYKSYLKEALGPATGRGRRSELARELRCHPAFVFRVLNQDAHLRLEQADRVNRFLGHDDSAARYFMLLVGMAKAGTPSLKAFYRRELREVAEGQRDLRRRYGAGRKQLPAEVAEKYYGHWAYGAVDLLAATGLAADAAAVARRLGIAPELAERMLGELVSWGLLERKAEGGYRGLDHVHLPRNSPHIVRHHLNWRLKALALLAEAPEKGLHYSNVMVISREDAARIETEILDLIQKTVARAKASPPEEPYSLCLDFYGL